MGERMEVEIWKDTHVIDQGDAISQWLNGFTGWDQHTTSCQCRGRQRGTADQSVVACQATG